MALKIEVKCPNCKKIRLLDKYNTEQRIREGRFTGLCCKCNGLNYTLEKGRLWRGGRNLGSSGHIRVKLLRNSKYIEMACKDGYILEHRLIMAIRIGRLLTPDEVVHHIDGDMCNNDFSNLQLMSRKEHSKLHRDKQLLNLEYSSNGITI